MGDWIAYRPTYGRPHLLGFNMLVTVCQSYFTNFAQPDSLVITVRPSVLSFLCFLITAWTQNSRSYAKVVIPSPHVSKL